MPESAPSTDPLEVRLVGAIADCRACGWFWGPMQDPPDGTSPGSPPYGPYPAFDFVGKYPGPVMGQKPRAGDRPFKWLTGRCVGSKYVDPQQLGGCRKAPIMTLGINPNMTAYWPGPTGAAWAYPYFTGKDRDAKSAYYYRYRTIYQESFSRDFITKNLDPSNVVRAERDGEIVAVNRDPAARRATLTLRFDAGEGGPRAGADDSGSTGLVTAEEGTWATYEWPDDEDLAFLRYPGHVKAGDVIAAFRALPPKTGRKQPVYHNVTGYNARFIPILKQFEGYLKSQGRRASLHLAEDVCQLDMVACASPGWKNSYEIDKCEVVGHCVTNAEQGWVVKQILVVQPAVIVFAGQAAFSMFAEVFGHLIEPRIPLTAERFEAFARTTRRPHYLTVEGTVEGETLRFRTRIVVGTHFSYDDNYALQARFGRDDWKTFGATYPGAVAWLSRQHTPKGQAIVQGPTEDGFWGVNMEGRLPEFQERCPEAVPDLMAHLYDPYGMIADALRQEFELGNLGLRSDGHLARTGGPCRFCVNERWKLKGGCAYGKPDDPDAPPHAPDFLEKIAGELLDGVTPAECGP